LKRAACALCGKSIRQGRAKIIEEIDGEFYEFDREECAVLLKKFKSVYGSSFLS
jgi:ribosomal protein L24E